MSFVQCVFVRGGELESFYSAILSPPPTLCISSLKCKSKNIELICGITEKPQFIFYSL